MKLRGNLNVTLKVEAYTIETKVKFSVPPKGNFLRKIYFVMSQINH
jgi:hypothetical protein